MTEKSDEAIQAEIAQLEGILAERKKERDRQKYPIKAKFYSHTSDEDNAADAIEYGFTRDTEPFNKFCDAGYEIKFDILVHENGTVYATHVNDVALTEPVEI